MSEDQPGPRRPRKAKPGGAAVGFKTVRGRSVGDGYKKRAPSPELTDRQLEVLRAFDPGEVLRVADVAARVPGNPYSALRTLAAKGHLLRSLQDGTYRLPDDR